MLCPNILNSRIFCAHFVAQKPRIFTKIIVFFHFFTKYVRCDFEKSVLLILVVDLKKKYLFSLANIFLYLKYFLYIIFCFSNFNLDRIGKNLLVSIKNEFDYFKSMTPFFRADPQNLRIW